MSDKGFRTWQAIQEEVLRRIHAREWPPGHIIPNEVELTTEFGCARATVNRALQALADEGILERRRKAGTRVALHPVSRATFAIPLIREEISDLGHTYGYACLSQETAVACPWSKVVQGTKGLHVLAVHSADDAPYVLEDRWINTETAPQAMSQDFEHVSANEWLLATVPYTHGDITFAATGASEIEAEHFSTAPGTPLFMIERTTWDDENLLTTVRLSYRPGHRMLSRIGR